jgi:hypothetical protein
MIAGADDVASIDDACAGWTSNRAAGVVDLATSSVLSRHQDLAAAPDLCEKRRDETPLHGPASDGVDHFARRSPRC